MKGPGSWALRDRWGVSDLEVTAEVVGTIPDVPVLSCLVLFLRFSTGVLASYVRIRFCLYALLSHSPWAMRGAVEICGSNPSLLIFVFVPALRVHNVKWKPE